MHRVKTSCQVLTTDVCLMYTTQVEMQQEPSNSVSMQHLQTTCKGNQFKEYFEYSSLKQWIS
jgi:hypothetical protein